MKISQNFYISPYNTDILGRKLGGIFRKIFEESKNALIYKPRERRFIRVFSEIFTKFSFTAVYNKRYIADLKEMYPDYDTTRCFVTHSCADEELVQLAKDLVKENFQFDEVVETVAGSIITSHCGRNTLGVLFITK